MGSIEGDSYIWQVEVDCTDTDINYLNIYLYTYLDYKRQLRGIRIKNKCKIWQFFPWFYDIKIPKVYTGLE